MTYQLNVLLSFPLHFFLFQRENKDPSDLRYLHLFYRNWLDPSAIHLLHGSIFFRQSFDGHESLAWHDKYLYLELIQCLNLSFLQNFHHCHSRYLTIPASHYTGTFPAEPDQRCPKINTLILVVLHHISFCQIFSITIVL